MAFAGLTMRSMFRSLPSAASSGVNSSASASASIIAQHAFQRRAFRTTPMLRAPERVATGFKMHEPKITEKSDHSANAQQIKSKLKTSFQGRMADPKNVNSQSLESLRLQKKQLVFLRSLPKGSPFLESMIQRREKNQQRVRVSAGSITNANGKRPKKGAKDPYGGIDTTYDDRGHLVPEKGVVAAFKDKVNLPDNVVAENRTINQRYKKAFEDTAKALSAKKGSKIETFHVPVYKGNNPRPTHIRHYAVSDGTVIYGVKFPNFARDISGKKGSSKRVV